MNILFEKTLCFTGHRPDVLYGYDYKTEGNMKILKKLRALIVRFIERRGITTFITGMALGIDMWAGQIILQLKEKYPQIKLVCAVPCANHSAKWNKEDKEVHADILSRADHVYYVSDKPYTAWCMNDRNKWMVDQSRFVLAVWNGFEKGGTWNTVEYTRKRGRSMCRLHPNTLEIELS